jgi:hypothetical protein
VHNFVGLTEDLNRSRAYADAAPARALCSGSSAARTHYLARDRARRVRAGAVAWLGRRISVRALSSVEVLVVVRDVVAHRVYHSSSTDAPQQTVVHKGDDRRIAALAFGVPSGLSAGTANMRSSRLWNEIMAGGLVRSLNVRRQLCEP